MYVCIPHWQVASRVNMPLENLEKDMMNLEGNLKRSGHIISRMKEEASKLNQLGPSSQVQRVESASKAVTLSDPIKFVPHTETSQPGVEQRPYGSCNFSRTPSGVSADVKVKYCIIF